MPQPRKPTPLKHCPACNHKMERRTYNGRLEDLAAFNRRKYCNRVCMAKGFTKDNPSLAALRWRAAKYRGTVCQRCRATQGLHIHHVDGNPANNEARNLMTLCGSCHQTWHWENGRTPSRKSPPCSICGALSRKLGMCQKHYQRFKRHGSPYAVKRKIGSGWQLVNE